MRRSSSASPSPLERPGVRWGLQFGLWTAVGAAFVAQYLALHFSEGVPFKWDVAAWQLVGWYVWLALTPAIVYLTRRYPIERARWRRRAAFHLAIAVAMSVAEVAFYTLLQGGVKRWVQAQPFDFVDAFRSALLQSLFFDVLFYACIGAVAHALSLERAYRARSTSRASKRSSSRRSSARSGCSSTPTSSSTRSTRSQRSWTRTCAAPGA